MSSVRLEWQKDGGSESDASATTDQNDRSAKHYGCRVHYLKCATSISGTRGSLAAQL